MSKINVLDKNTIDKIAAGEVVDRPASIVKELLENAIDAKANAITIEIKDGGISFIRITDNGEGIAKSDVKNAFLRHATSKIRSATDLLNIHSLGFRGEALSSIAAVSQLECISKTSGDLTGVRYVIEGGEEKSLEEVGAPSGTTFIIRNLFYNTPARRKFLKSAATEGSYISNIIEKIALSHPDISIRFIVGANTKFHTSGNGKLKDIIYTIYGKEVAMNVLELDTEFNSMKIRGYIGKPVITRGNRNNMIYFINGRYIKSKIIYSAIEEAYKSYIMQHNYPFCVIHFEIAPELIDVNVHPSKMEIRFENQTDVYNFFYDTIHQTLQAKDHIREVKDFGKVPDRQGVRTDVIKEESATGYNRQNQENRTDVLPLENSDMDFRKVSDSDIKKAVSPDAKQSQVLHQQDVVPAKERPAEPFEVQRTQETMKQNSESKQVEFESAGQVEMFNDEFLSKKEKIKHKMIGQLFDTYWLIEYNEHLYIIDQHAAHEKVLYERTMKKLKNKEFTSQQLNPPIILTLSMQEEELVLRFMDNFKELGYEIEPFGGREYAVYAVPDNLYALGSEELLRDIIDHLDEESSSLKSDMITDKIASMSCKAAVKGNNKLSFQEADALIEELLTLENPYNCPHGRPTIISMSKYEIEKKFKRII